MVAQSSLIALGASSARSWALAMKSESLEKSGVPPPVNDLTLAAEDLRSLQYPLELLLPPPPLPQPVTRTVAMTAVAVKAENFRMPHSSGPGPPARTNDDNLV